MLAGGPGNQADGTVGGTNQGKEACGRLRQNGDQRVGPVPPGQDHGSPGAGPGGPAGAAQWAGKFRDIQSITDAALSALDPQALLNELVGRVREALQADTAAVLLLDHPKGQLVAAAAAGLEEEVQQGTRVPLGRGFAGQIAALGQPVILDVVDHATVVNPILLDKGVRSLLGAPLRAGGGVIGVMHVGTLSGRHFTSQDMDLLQLAADRAAVAVQALYTHLDRAATTVLQRSLLPSALPAVGGLELAARYVPGSGTVGGDWYDVFSLPTGDVCAVIGDVTGSGLNAAVIMGRMRSALRAYALESSDPADVLERLSRKMRHFEPDAMASVLCAMVSPSTGQVRLSSAGHPPPLIARPGQPAGLAEVAPGGLIGMASPAPRPVSTLDLPPGSVLCLYTDGLVERRDRSIDDGIARLAAALTAGPPENACASVMLAMAGYVTHTDDIALLMVHRPPAGPGQADSGQRVEAP